MGTNERDLNLAGTRMAGYELLERVSSGAMGVVYKARQVSMDRIVAVKILPPDLAKDRTFVERFFREARAAGRLNHPNIVSGLDVGEAEGHYYFAMEYVEGDTLTTVLKRQGPLPEAQALQITAAIARGLVHAFQQGIVHRDIKPSNIILVRDGTPKLLDLGTAAMRSGALSNTEAALGTPYYTSPEQARGQQQADARSDIYSLGATLYHMLTGSVPFDGPSIPAILARHISDPVPDPRAKNPRLSPPAAALVMRMMAKRPEDRFQTPVALLTAIERLSTGRPPTAVSAARAATPARGAEVATAARPGLSRVARARKKSYAGLIVVIIMVVGSLGGAGWLIYNRQKSGGLPGMGHGPGPSAAEMREQEAKKQLDDAKTFAQQNPEKYAEAIGLLSYVIRTFPDTIPADQAQVERSALEERRNAAANKLLEAALTKAKTYMADQDFRHALGSFSEIGAQFLIPEVRQRVDEAKALIRKQAQTTLENVDKKAIDFWQAGKPEEAIKTLEYSRQYQLNDQRSYIDQRIAQIREAMEKKLPPKPVPFHTTTAYAGPRERRPYPAFAVSEEVDIRLRYAAAAEALLKLIAQHDHQKAAQGIEKALADPALAPAKPDLEADREVLRIATRVWDEIGAAVGRLKGQDIFVGGIRGRVEGFSDGQIVYVSYGATIKAPLTNLKTLEAAQVIEKGSSRPPADVLGDLVVYLAALGETTEAEKKLQAMQADGLPTDEPAALLAHLRLARQEIEATGAVERLKSQLPLQDWKGAAESLAILTRLADLPTAKAVSEQIEPWRRWTAEAGFLSGFFRVTAVASQPGVTQVAYDFANAKQLRDWEQLGGAWHAAQGVLIQSEEHGTGTIRSRGRWLDAIVRFDAVPLSNRGAVGLAVSDVAGAQIVLAVEGDRYSILKGRVGDDPFAGEAEELPNGRLAAADPRGKLSILGFLRDGKMRFVVNGLEAGKAEVADFKLETFGIVARGRCAVDNVSAEGALLTGWIEDQIAKATGTSADDEW